MQVSQRIQETPFMGHAFLSFRRTFPKYSSNTLIILANITNQNDFKQAALRSITIPKDMLCNCIIY